MVEQRFTVGDQITVVVTGEMTGITPDGTLTVQYPSSLGACETHVELEDTSVVVMHERDADKATPVLIEERDSARAEVERLRAERARAVEALGSIGRTAVAATGDLEDGINAELIARERADDTARGAYRRITSDGTEAAPMAKQLTGHMPPDADIETILADPGGACPGCVRIVIEGFRAEVERLRAERDAARVGMEKLRGLHRGVCVGACGLDDACECEERDLACAECAASWPCATIRALDGTEAGQ